jgi:predicted amidohydrolase
MRDPLTLAVAQPVCAAHDVDANARTHAATVRAAGTRVVVFPELSLTGYELDAATLDTADPRLAPLIEACADTGSVALAGAPVEGPSGPHIAVLAIDADGVRVAYRKIWLGAEEAGRVTPGPAPVAFEIDGWRLGLAVCKDSGIAQHATDTAALGIDGYVAGTLMFPSEVDEQNDRARRIARMISGWVAVASFAGPTGGGYDESAGCSGIWQPDGAVLVQSGPETGAISRATLA